MCLARQTLLVEENLLDGVKHDLHIAPEGDVLDIFQISGELFLPAQRVPAAGLGKACEPGANGVPTALLGRHEDHIAHQLRPGADDRHVTF